VSAPQDVAGVRLTSPDKVLWPVPGITKRELAEYWVLLADRVVPAVRDRPLSLVRCPDGVTSGCFYQKHAQGLLPGVLQRVPVREQDGRMADYVALRDTAGLVYTAQVGTCELHPWLSRRDRIGYPDMLVFDLDPDVELEFGAVVRAAVELRQRLADLGLQSACRTTGGKGLHVIAPTARRRPFDDTRRFAWAVARSMELDAPDRFTTNMQKSERPGRVFIDYLRNGPGATAVASYSPRARAGAPVATPVAWEEVTAALRPARYHLRSIPARLAELGGGDPWSGAANARQSLTARMLRFAASVE
jgi:bifunctional non-homologous end joining protein LigD